MSFSSKVVSAALAGPAIGSSPRRKRVFRRRTRVAIVRHFLLILGALISIFPFYWMLVLATHSSSAIYKFPPVLLPGNQLGNNLSEIFSKVNIWAAMANTALVAISVTVLVMLISSLTAFAFAKYDFPGKKIFFAIIMITFLLPTQLATIPQFLFMSKLGWVGDLKAVIVPSLASAFGVFWLRQYASSAIPDDLLEAARIDGCGFWRQYFHVCLPLIRPALGFLGMFSFIGAWNDFMWPLIVLNDPSKLTLQVVLSQLKAAHGTDYGMLMASALISIVPLLLVFFVGAKQFISGIADGALKS